MSPRWFANESIFRTKDFVDRAASLCSAAIKLFQSTVRVLVAAGPGPETESESSVCPSQAQADALRRCSCQYHGHGVLMGFLVPLAAAAAESAV